MQRERIGQLPYKGSLAKKNAAIKGSAFLQN